MISLFSMACLGDAGVASIMAGQSPSSKTYNIVGDGLPFFQGKADFGYTYPVPRIWCNQPHKIAKRGDILISVRAPVGDVNIADRDCAIGRGLAAIRAENSVDTDFLFFSLKHVRQKLIDNSTGSTFSSINISTLQDIEIPFPDKKIRYQIGILLQYIYKNIEYEFDLYTKVQTLKNTVMHKLFTCGLRGEAQKETEIGLVPESWEVCHLETIASLERGRFMHRPRNEPRFYGGHMPFIQTGDVVRSGGYIKEYTQTLNEDGVCISRVFPVGTILITIAANIGYTGILKIEAACPDSLVAIIPNESVIVQYLHYYLQTQQPKMDQAAPKGTQKNINIQFLSPWPVPVPPTEKEQQGIVDILDAIDQKIDLHRRKKAVLEELFKSLLHKLMTGEIRVDEIDLSALEALQQPGGAA